MNSDGWNSKTRSYDDRTSLAAGNLQIEKLESLKFVSGYAVQKICSAVLDTLGISYCGVDVRGSKIVLKNVDQSRDEKEELRKKVAELEAQIESYKVTIRTMRETIYQ